VCGIIGYIGKRNVQEVLLSGLRRLEYRGYDSAGIAVFHQGTIAISRTEGKSKIWKSRWKTVCLMATLGSDILVGLPTAGLQKKCASPYNGSVAIVHNGIIENYLSLKEMLRKKDTPFSRNRHRGHSPSHQPLLHGRKRV